jgi:hypothetical protein
MDYGIYEIIETAIYKIKRGSVDGKTTLNPPT